LINSIVIIQARTSSLRLPGKVMLPVKGIPVVVLAAKRASNTGKKVIVAISTEPSDDGLANLLESYKVNYSRGSLEDPLGRIVNTLRDYPNETIVFRLTADNVFPDGFLLDQIESEFLEKKLEYMICNGGGSGVPYGMSAEITRLYALREAEKNTKNKFDREHVMPFVIRKYGVTFFTKYKDLNKGHYRCTIDCFDDFINIQSVFEEISDPISASFEMLMSRLEKIPLQPICSVPTPKFVLGTAQLGGDYGLTNTSGQPTLTDAKAIIKTAVSNGVIYIDTAREYGDSEQVIGAVLREGWQNRATVITKLANITSTDLGVSPTVANQFVNASVYESCVSLGVTKLDVLMLHRASHITQWNGWVWDRLLELKKHCVIGQLGVSVQTPDELSEVLKNDKIEFIQMPFNLLDWRWEKLILDILSVKKKRNLQIHVRSVLLQGLLTSLDDANWVRAHVADGPALRRWLANQVKINKKSNIIDLCISYVNSHQWIDGIVIGLESMGQLIENLKYFNEPTIQHTQMKEITRSRPRLESKTLNPALWG